MRSSKRIISFCCKPTCATRYTLLVVFKDVSIEVAHIVLNPGCSTVVQRRHVQRAAKQETAEVGD